MNESFELNLLELNYIINQIIDDQPIYHFPQDLTNFLFEIRDSLSNYEPELTYVLESRLKSIQIYLDQYEDCFPIKIVSTEE
jgi:hypothetical protein